MRRLSHHLKQFARECTGAEIAEAAAVLPLMFLILIGIFWFGQAFSIYGAITRAAQDGARAGAAPYCATCSTASTLSALTTNAVNAVQTSLTASRLDPAKAQYPSPQPVFNACSGASTGCNSGASTNVCVQMPVQLSNHTAGATGVCGVSVSFRYPFQFWLPFTSLNQQKVWMTASAHVRMETP